MIWNVTTIKQCRDVAGFDLMLTLESTVWPLNIYSATIFVGVSYQLKIETRCFDNWPDLLGLRLIWDLKFGIIPISLRIVAPNAFVFVCEDLTHLGANRRAGSTPPPRPPGLQSELLESAMGAKLLFLSQPSSDACAVSIRATRSEMDNLSELTVKRLSRVQKR